MSVETANGIDVSRNSFCSSFHVNNMLRKQQKSYSNTSKARNFLGHADANHYPAHRLYDINVLFLLTNILPKCYCNQAILIYRFSSSFLVTSNSICRKILHKKPSQELETFLGIVHQFVAFRTDVTKVQILWLLLCKCIFLKIIYL